MSADNAYAVELKGVSFKRGTRSIFNNVDIRIPRGKVTGENMTPRDPRRKIQ